MLIVALFTFLTLDIFLNNRVCLLASATLAPFLLRTVKGLGSYLVVKLFACF